MRIIQTVKQLNEWQLTQQDSGKTWALLPFLNGLPRESNALLHGARIRCDLVLTVLDGNSENNRTALNSLSESDCDAVLLLDAELNRPCVTVSVCNLLSLILNWYARPIINASGCNCCVCSACCARKWPSSACTICCNTGWPTASTKNVSCL